jgi:acyl-CoA synthetase (AMP-forming)/AMP-acid ligase II
MDEFNLGLVNETIAAAIPDREVLVWRDRRLTYAQVAERSRRLASYLHGQGLGVRRERGSLTNHESGQDHVALYLYNGNEYLEAMLGAFKSRTVPINVNYRYVEEELRYLFLNSQAKAVVYHGAFAESIAAIRGQLPDLRVLIQVDDGSGAALLPGAVDYEEVLAASSPELLDIGHSPDDLYVLYTGGTTGMPKGVLWRQHDVFMNTMGGRIPGIWDPVSSYDEVRERVLGETGDRLLLNLPFMHGGGQWTTFTMMSRAGTMVLPDEVTRFDPASVLRAVEREGCVTITLVGDAMARPLVEEIGTGDYDLSGVVLVSNGGAPMTPAIKERLLEVLPSIIINDSMGSSEAGAQGSHLSVKGAVATGTFRPGPGTTVLSEGLDAVLEPGAGELGWFAQRGWVPLGYLGDADKTAATFPVVDGVRFSVPGDRARLLADGTIQVLGRDAVTINTGGEKVFAEEVESAISSHPLVRDVVVCGRQSERWGSEVVAVLAVGRPVTEEELTAHVATSLARYKLPKAWVFVDEVLRSPSGKADYRWAREVAEKGNAGLA